MSGTDREQEARILLRRILFQSSSGCAHWFEVLSDYNRPHSLAKFLNITYMQLEMILVAAGLASRRTNQKKNEYKLIFLRDSFIAFVSGLNREEGFQDHFEFDIKRTSLGRKTYVLRVGGNEDGAVVQYHETDDLPPPIPMTHSVDDRNALHDFLRLPRSAPTKKNKKRKKAPLKPPPPAACQGIPHAKLQQTATNPSVVPPKEWVWIRNNFDQDEKISDERPLKGIVEQIREQFTKTNTNDSVQTLLRVLNENLQDGERQYTDDDGKEFVESIRETIQNYAKVLQNKENSLQFSPHTLRLAMSIWLKNTTAYEELRKGDTAGKWPSSSKLRKLRNATKVRSGRCGVKYDGTGKE